MKALKVLLLVLALATQVSAQETLRARDQAPFAGILIPDKTYAQMWADIITKDALEQELRVCLDNKYAASGEVEKAPSGGIWMGLIGGALTVFLLSHKK